MRHVLRILAALLALGEVTSFAVVEVSRRGLTNLVPRGDGEPLGGVFRVLALLAASRSATVVAMSAPLVAIPLVAFGFLRRAWRAEGRVCRLAWVAPGLVAAMGWTTALFCLRIAWSEGMQFDGARELFYEHVVTSFGVRDAGVGRACVLAFAALASLVALATPQRASLVQAHRGAGARAVPAIVFAVGALAFVWTRGRAFDARHPLPYVADAAAESRDVPIGTRCRPLMDAPEIRLRSGSAWVDGVPATPLEAATILENKRRLWKLTHSGREAPTDALIAAPAETSMTDARPFVLAARDAGFAGVSALLERPVVRVTTRTVGVVERWVGCSVALEAGLPAAGTWGDMVHALQPGG